MQMLTYAAAVLAVLSGAVVGAFGVLSLVVVLDDWMDVGPRQNTTGLMFGVAATALGLLLLVAGAEIWP